MSTPKIYGIKIIQNRSKALCSVADFGVGERGWDEAFTKRLPPVGQAGLS